MLRDKGADDMVDNAQGQSAYNLALANKHQVGELLLANKQQGSW